MCFLVQLHKQVHKRFRLAGLCQLVKFVGNIGIHVLYRRNTLGDNLLFGIQQIFILGKAETRRDNPDTVKRCQLVPVLHILLAVGIVKVGCDELIRMVVPQISAQVADHAVPD